MKTQTREYRFRIILLRGLMLAASALYLLGEARPALAGQTTPPNASVSGETAVVPTKAEEALSDSSKTSHYAPEPAPESVFLTVPYHSQITETSIPNACGPTSMLMAMEYLGYNESLQGIIYRLQSISPADGGYDPQCAANPVCTSPGTLAGVVEGYGLDVQAAQGWTLEDVHSSLAAGNPIIADITWRLMEGGPGHFVVIYGVDVEAEVIYYHDPYDGAARAANWQDFARSWDGPVDVDDPLQPEGHRSWGVSIGIDE